MGLAHDTRVWMARRPAGLVVTRDFVVVLGVVAPLAAGSAVTATRIPAALWAKGAGGCHPNRRTAEATRAAGFVVEEIDRFAFRPLRLLPPAAHILGRAQRSPVDDAAAGHQAQEAGHEAG